MMIEANDPVQWAALQEAFRQAVTLAPPLRERMLADVALRDPAMHGSLLRLLAAHDNDRNRLDQPASMTTSGRVTEGGDLVGRVIGHYRIEQLIGIGGLGAVYRAIQEQPRRAVALKLPRFDAASSDLLQRLEFEAEVLGRLQHPSIAQIIEAGTYETDSGPRPFFAMELVEGLALHEYVRCRALAVRQRVELLIRICEGVEHAHQRGVIHRDLKPANILVVDESPPATEQRTATPACAARPKILDFGIARLVGGSGRAPHTLTTGHILGTLAYMSPEQLNGSPAIDTRTDIHALGVIGFELLAGRLPFDGLDRASPIEAIATMRDHDPPTLASIDTVWRGDLSAIIAKAMAGEPSHRYASATEFAADLARYLRDEAVLARPPSLVYQLQRFGRRNRAVVVGALATVTALGAGVVGFAWKAAAEARQRAVAMARLTDVLNLNAQALELVGVELANLAGGTRLRRAYAQSALQGLVKVCGETPHATELDYQLGYAHQRLGEAQLDMGEADAALHSFQEALRIRERLSRRTQGAVRMERARAVGLWKVGDALLGLGRCGEATAMYRESFAIHERLARDPESTAVESGVYLGLAHRRLADGLRAGGHVKEAVDELTRALDWFDAGLLDDPQNVQLRRGQAQALRCLGEARGALGQHGPAESDLNRSLAVVAALDDRSGPANVWERLQRCRALLALVDVLSASARPDDARAAGELAYDLADSVAKADPDLLEARVLRDRARQGSRAED